ncbi:hypothetical protein ACJRO7_032115 [Eucalyptus globulus]|uniref:Major facilitator superfamily (MFS) profile domain-containing protein n=1 Tax=Eucalyptus globulus TaxID=34317 RepID=A0ABD3JPN2_EUCGL
MPAVVMSHGGQMPKHDGKIIFYVIVCVILAAFGGMLFEYDNGISGGATAMDDFLKKFFMTVYEKKKRAHEYCKYDNESFQLFTSSLYIAALVASFVASKVCSKIILGCGVGFANQAVPLFLSELAPARITGALNICFQLFITIGILIAGIINYFTSNIHLYGWWISVGLASIPAVILLMGSFIICETPTILIKRNWVDQGKATLRRICGTDNVDAEFNSIHPFRKLMRLSSRPPLVIAMSLQVFQQFTEINAIMFNNAVLLSTVITELVNVFSTLVLIYLVDKAGQRVFCKSFPSVDIVIDCFMELCYIGVLLLLHLKPAGSLNPTEAIVVVVLVCIFVMGFAWSWGPLGWLIPSETFPLETRTAGFSFAVNPNRLFTFIIAQAFLSMLCHMRAGIFFFAAWILVMGLFTLFLLPETKGVPVDSMVERVLKQHWFWKWYMICVKRNGGESSQRKKKT